MMQYSLEEEKRRYISLTWTNEEIVRSFKQAKDKVKQVEILADHTSTDIDTILVILKDYEAFKPKTRKCELCYKTYKTISTKGKAICPECQKTTKEIVVLKRNLKYITAKIQQLGLESAQIRAKIKSLEEARNDKN